MNLLFTSLFILSLINPPQGFNDRRIIVISALEHTSDVNNQIDKLQKSTLKLEERKLAVYTLIDGHLKPILNSSKKSQNFLEKNKSRFISDSNLKIRLIGLDSGVKKSYSDVVEPNEIFGIVDSMPMRRAEMNRH